MTDKKLVLSTAGSKEEAQKIARTLVERLLAACVNIVAVESIYRWEGEVEQAQEWLLRGAGVYFTFSGERECRVSTVGWRFGEVIFLLAQAGDASTNGGENGTG